MYVKYFGGTVLEGSNYELYAEVPDNTSDTDLDEAAIEAAAMVATEFWSGYCVVVEDEQELTPDDWAELASDFFDDMASSANWQKVSQTEYNEAIAACTAA